MKVRDLPLDHYVDQLKAQTPFAFVRYGNGEWDCIFSRYHSTRSGSHTLLIARMRIELERSIREAYTEMGYHMALRSTSLNVPVRSWLTEQCPKRNWVECTAFYRASRHGRLFPFIDALRHDKRPLIVVGPDHLRGLAQRGLDIDTFVEVPPKNCYYQKRDILRQILNAPRPAIISISAGPPAKIMVFELWRRLRDTNSVILDLGSLWDVYCNVQSRRYHSKMTETIIHANLYGE
jgi:hypothetical protein